MNSVPGIRFYPSSISVETNGGTPIFLHGTIQGKRSDFDYIFEPLYPSWNDSVFLDESGLIRIFDPDFTQEQENDLHRRLDSYAIQRGNDRFGNSRKLVKCSAFREFGRCVYEFEGAGFCVLESGVTLERALEIEADVWSRRSLKELPQGVICIVQNWDGVFWQIFSTDPAHLQILQAAHADSDVLSAYWVDLSEDFPNPRGASPEEVGMTRVESIVAPIGRPPARDGNSNVAGGPQ